jgi:hypothetical protein
MACFQVKRSRVVHLKVTNVEHHGIQPMSSEHKASITTELAGFAKREKQAREVAATRNDLEAYIINTRSKLEDDELIIKVQQPVPCA